MEKDSRSRKVKVDLLTLHVDVGDMELCSSSWPQGLEFEALRSDPSLSGQSCFQLGAIQDAGKFFQVNVGDTVFCLHEAAVERMYRIDDNFSLKRNYYYNTTPQQSASYPETKGQNMTFATANSLDPGDRSNQQEQMSVLRGHGFKPSSPWGDFSEDEEPDPLGGMTAGFSTLTVENRKHTNVKFLNEYFLDTLPNLGQERVSARDFLERFPKFKGRDFYLFDFAAMFVDCQSVLINFEMQQVCKKLEVLSQLAKTEQAFMPMQVDREGWNPITRFLCLSLNGEHQISFLKMALLFSVRKVASSAAIKRYKRMSEETRSFLLGGKSIQNDACRIIRLNLNAMNNNDKVLVDEYYAFNCVSDPDE